MKYNKTQLQNGLSVILLDTGSYPTCTTLILFNAGSRYENTKNNGIAHFLEHMLFKGSKKYPNTVVISTLLDGLGGISNAFTSKDYTGYYIKAPTEHFHTSIDVLSDIVQNPLLQEEEIARERGVIIEEINMYADNPSQDVFDLFEELLYNKSTLGMRVIGTKETVANAKRSTFTNFLNSLYIPNNAVVVVAGGLQTKKITPNIIQKLINEKFGNWKQKKLIHHEKVQSNQEKPAVLIDHKKTQQYHFCVGFRGFSWSDDRKYALLVLSALLGVGMSSRLFIEVRERRGLCYYIHSMTDHYIDTGSFLIHAGIRANTNTLKDALSVILEQCAIMTQKKIDTSELDKAKEIIKGRLLLSMEDTFNVAQFFGKKLIHEGHIKTPAEVLSLIDRVNDNDIINVSRDIFLPKGLNMAIIGAVSEKHLSPVLSWKI